MKEKFVNISATGEVRGVNGWKLTPLLWKKWPKPKNSKPQKLQEIEGGPIPLPSYAKLSLQKPQNFEIFFFVWRIGSVTLLTKISQNQVCLHLFNEIHPQNGINYDEIKSLIVKVKEADKIQIINTINTPRSHETFSSYYRKKFFTHFCKLNFYEQHNLTGIKRRIEINFAQ